MLNEVFHEFSTVTLGTERKRVCVGYTICTISIFHEEVLDDYITCVCFWQVTRPLTVLFSDAILYIVNTTTVQSRENADRQK